MAQQVNGINGVASHGLKILIAGAGIGGLTAAIGLRQQGHEVILFEQSRLASETGAAIHLAPNAWGLLERLNVDMTKIGANLMEGMANYDAQGNLRFPMEYKGPMAEMWKHPWGLAHRQKLHSALKATATDPNGRGPPATLRTSSRVISVDCASATATMEDGSTESGDLVIGADGVHSTVRCMVPGGNLKAFDSGKSAFRFMMPRSKLQDDPATASLLPVAKTGRLGMWIGEDRRLVMYPCQNNELLNFVAIHPSSESDARGSDWQQGGNKDRLLEVYKSFGSVVQTMLSHVDSATLKVWALLDMEQLPTWVNGKLALIGDAAHPFLPHQGQGGAMAIEDGVALAAVLPGDCSKDETAERLKLYEKCRYERAHRIQEYTRIAGKDQSEIDKVGGKGLDITEFTQYNFGHDAWDYARQQLRKWELSRLPAAYWRMPTAFGPAPGPRQDVFGKPQNTSHSSLTVASIKFKTSRTYLESIMPSPAFSFQSPGTTAYASWIVMSFGKMDWLSGSGYNTCGLYIHGVKYTKKDGSFVGGTLLPVLFESFSDPIVTGREELGMPKVFADIDLQNTDSGTSVRLSWRGGHFGSLEWQDFGASEPQQNGVAHADTPPATQPQHGPPPPREEGTLAYKYIPAVGQRGVADVEYAVLDPGPDEAAQPVIHETKKTTQAHVSMDAGSVKTLPTLHHIVKGLAEVPNYGIMEAKVVKGEGVYDVARCKRIE